MTTSPTLDASFSPPPGLHPFTRIHCEVGAVHSLGAAPLGERRYVPLQGGRVLGPELNGRIVDGGVDWQIARADGVLEIDAHYVIEAEDGARIEVRSQGLRCGPPEVMDRLARGEDVPADAYYFRTAVRLTTGAPAWAHLNRLLVLASGRRQARSVWLELWRVG
ncbi:MAG: hypothetical protein RIQ53_84 [Pseudomonadota bacterium]|jgi:hypothetical protein